MFLRALHVLVVLLGLECEFFESPVGLPEVLAGLGVAALLGVELSLQLANAGLQLGDDALASLVGGGLLGLLLGVLQLGDGIVHVGLHSLEILLQLALGAGEHGVGAGELLDASSGVVELALGGLAGSVG